MSRVPDSSVPSIRVHFRALVMDPVSHMPVVILQHAERHAYLPIWIGICEANAIALHLEELALAHVLHVRVAQGHEGVGHPAALRTEHGRLQRDIDTGAHLASKYPRENRVDVA